VNPFLMYILPLVTGFSRNPVTGKGEVRSNWESKWKGKAEHGSVHDRKYWRTLDNSTWHWQALTAEQQNYTWKAYKSWLDEYGEPLERKRPKFAEAIGLGPEAQKEMKQGKMERYLQGPPKMWLRNYFMVQKFNRLSTGEKWKLNMYSAANKSSDGESEQFFTTGLKLRSSEEEQRRQLSASCKTAEDFSSSLPTSKTWDGWLPDVVEDQGACSSCTAFATAVLISTMVAIKKDSVGYTWFRNRQLSTQFLMDCSSGSLGCYEGASTYEDHLSYLTDVWAENSKGMLLESDYPYELSDVTTGHAGDVCQKTEPSASKSTETHSCISISQDNADYKESLQQALQIGPVAIGIKSCCLASNYGSGIILKATSDDCLDAGVDHAVLLVGYGKEDGTKYWLVRNSWGSSWGIDGYFKLQMNANICGISDIKPAYTEGVDFKVV